MSVDRYEVVVRSPTEFKFTSYGLVIIRLSRDSGETANPMYSTQQPLDLGCVILELIERLSLELCIILSGSSTRIIEP